MKGYILSGLIVAMIAGFLFLGTAHAFAGFDYLPTSISPQQHLLCLSDLQAAYGSNSKPHVLGEPVIPIWNPQADLNKDGVIDLADLVLFSRTSPLLLNISADNVWAEMERWTNITVFAHNISRCVLNYTVYTQNGDWLPNSTWTSTTGSETMTKTGNQYTGTFNYSDFANICFICSVIVFDNNENSTIAATYIQQPT